MSRYVKRVAQRPRMAINRSDVKTDLPPLLTIEEAASLLRIGRTKAYAMASEWRQTGGASGLPVIDLGHVLRVPLRALEELAGAELSPRAERS